MDMHDVFEKPIFSISSTDKYFLLLCLATQYFIIRRLDCHSFGSFPLIFKSPSPFSYAYAIYNIIFFFRTALL
jgi:hypothetical protein